MKKQKSRLIIITHDFKDVEVYPLFLHSLVIPFLKNYSFFNCIKNRDTQSQLSHYTTSARFNERATAADKEKIHVVICFIIESKGDYLFEIDNAVMAFLKIPADAKATISNHIYQLYLDFVQAVDSDDLDFKISSQNEIWGHATPASIVVRKNSPDKQVYIQVFLDCDWDVEHGV